MKIDNPYKHGRFFVCDDCHEKRIVTEASRIGNDKFICLTCCNKIAYKNGIITKDQFIKSCKEINVYFRDKNYIKSHEQEDFLEHL